MRRRASPVFVSPVTRVRIRPYAERDRPFLQAMLAQETYWMTSDASDVASELGITLAGGYGKLIDEKCLVAIIDHDIAGFVLTAQGCVWDESLASTHFVLDLLVLPAKRGNGIGRLLLESVISATDDAALYVDSENHDAQRLYRRLGFEFV